MSQSDNNLPIENKDDYHEKFVLLKINTFQKTNDAVRKKQEKILEYALDIRKFEIKLYWERTKYFTSLIGGSFGAYALLRTGVLPVNNNDNQWIYLLLTFIGFILSLAWYLSNRGSKYWQENWERHVDALEYEIIGPLYKTTLNYEDNDVFNPLKAYPFSVSKINQIISLVSTIIWSCLFITSWQSAFNCLIKELQILPLLVTIIILMLILLWIFVHEAIDFVVDIFPTAKVEKFLKNVKKIKGMYKILSLLNRKFCRDVKVYVSTLIIPNLIQQLFSSINLVLYFCITLLLIKVIKAQDIIIRFIMDNNLQFHLISSTALLLSMAIILMYFTKGTSQDVKTRDINFKVAKTKHYHK